MSADNDALDAARELRAENDRLRAQLEASRAQVRWNAKAQREDDDLRAEVERLHRLLDGKSQYVDCSCPGCPRKVPEAWRAGMCQPCCEEDCDHGDGAKALIAERDELEARCRRHVEQVDEARRVAIDAERERDRLAAVLADTPENLEAHARATYAAAPVRLPGSSIRRWEDLDPLYRLAGICDARWQLASIRARCEGVSDEPCHDCGRPSRPCEAIQDYRRCDNCGIAWPAGKGVRR